MPPTCDAPVRRVYFKLPKVEIYPVRRRLVKSTDRAHRFARNQSPSGISIMAREIDGGVRLCERAQARQSCAGVGAIKSDPSNQVILHLGYIKGSVASKTVEQIIVLQEYGLVRRRMARRWDNGNGAISGDGIATVKCVKRLVGKLNEGWRQPRWIMTW